MSPSATSRATRSSTTSRSLGDEHRRLFGSPLLGEHGSDSSTSRASRSRPPSASSPTSSIRRRGAGPSGPTPTSSTSTKSTKATTSRPGRSRRSSRARSAPRSDHCVNKEEIMSTTVETTTEIRPSTSRFQTTQIDDLRRRIAATRWPTKELVAGSVAGRTAGDPAGARALLGERLRLRQSRGRAQRAAAVHDRDRRRGHPLHPRAVAARERAAADHDPRLARLGHRAARDDRPADRPDRARRKRRGRVPPRAAVPARLRLLRRARPSSAGAPAASRRPGRS